MEFKIGDKVRVKDGLGVWCALPSGKIVEITDIHYESNAWTFVSLKEYTGHWLIDRFEPVSKCASVLPNVGARMLPDESLNPKDAVGRSKLPIFSVVATTGIIEEAKAMRYGAYEAPRKDGGKGYGLYNWRDTQAAASVYIDACIRHILAWMDGEDLAPDSLAHHLAHARACLGIILDAAAVGTLIDDRPTQGKAAELLEAAKKEL